MSDLNSWPTTSVDLLKQLKNLGNAEAWDRFYRVYRPLLDRIGQRHGLQPADVEDVTQQVLIAVSKQIGNFEYDPERGKFRSWLAIITARTISKRWKAIAKHKAVSPVIDDLMEADFEAGFVEEFHGILLELALVSIQAQVPPLEWESFYKIWYEDASARQVAEDVERSLTWVYRTKYKLLDLLTQELRRLTDDVAFFHK